MQVLMDAAVILLAYILGAIPFGLLIVKVTTGKDIRLVASGRTGGTNAMRAAGCWAGAATTLFDIFKGAAAVWLARTLAPNIWIEVLAPIAAVLGHNYSVFLLERHSEGKIRLRGGAGGAPAAGGAIGLLWPMWWLILLGIPIPLLMFFGVGYASIATISISLTATAIFALLYFLGYSIHWQYIVYGVLTFVILLWALRPNIKALVEGANGSTAGVPGERKKTRQKNQNKQRGRPHGLPHTFNEPAYSSRAFLINACKFRLCRPSARPPRWTRLLPHSSILIESNVSSTDLRRAAALTTFLTLVI